MMQGTRGKLRLQAFGGIRQILGHRKFPIKGLILRRKTENGSRSKS